eukprot:2444843-Prymnesium_polylepis.1
MRIGIRKLFSAPFSQDMSEGVKSTQIESFESAICIIQEWLSCLNRAYNPYTLDSVYGNQCECSRIVELLRRALNWEFHVRHL